MQLTIEKADLLQALKRVAAIVPRSNTIPIVGMLKLEADDDVLNITGTDLEMWCSADALCADIETSGAVCVPVERFEAFARGVPDGAQIMLELSDADGRLNLRAGRMRARLATLPADDYPTGDFDAWPHAFALDAPVLAGMLNHTTALVGNIKNQWYLSGVFMEAVDRTTDEPAKLRFSATDGKRFGRIEAALPADGDMPEHDEQDPPDGSPRRAGVIVPGRTCQHILRLLDGVEGDAQLRFSPNAMAVELDGVRIVSKLVAGRFPFTERMIPDEIETPIETDPARLLACVQRIAAISGVLTTDKDPTIRVAVADGALDLSGRTAGNDAEAEDEVEASYEGEDYVFGFNPKWAADAFGWGGDRVHIHQTGPTAPLLIRDPAQPDRLHVFMPVLTK